jgi:hypothetical protein
LLEGFDYAVKAGYVWHILNSLRSVQVVQNVQAVQIVKNQAIGGRALNTL